jgi:uncharacterized protein YjbJ (UPF0337 family)
MKTEGRLDRARGRIREAWGDLTDDDFDRAQGNTEQLIGRIKVKTGEGADAIRDRLNSILSDEAESGSP